MSQLRTAVIGCGNIGGLCDSAEDTRVISHAHAYYRHPKFELTCCCDVNRDNIAAFRGRWGEQIKPYTDADEMFQTEEFEALSIATSTEAHARMMELALEEESVKLIICEKPFVATLGEMERIKQKLAVHPDKTVLINYQRRYDPGLESIAEMIRSEELGETLSFNAVFCKGLYHNGCHLMEMIDHFFGGLKSIEAERQVVRDGDFFGRYYLVAGACDGHIAAIDTDRYWLLEMDIYCRDGRIRLVDSGHQIKVYRPEDWSLYPGDKRLAHSTTVPDSLDHSMQHTLERGYRLMNQSSALSIFESHMILSEKLLVMKQAFEHGHTCVDWSKKRRSVSHDPIGYTWR